MEKTMTDALVLLNMEIKENEYQFRKLLHNKRPETYEVGFKLDFSIISKKDIEAYNDKTNIVVTEGRKVYHLEAEYPLLNQTLFTK